MKFERKNKNKPCLASENSDFHRGKQN